MTINFEQADQGENIVRQEVIAFLSHPDNHRNADRVQRIDTHISHVFLVGDRAYKLKRAVKLDYVDFSTLEKRRAACQT